jgi:hypothetical protein
VDEAGEPVGGDKETKESYGGGVNMTKIHCMQV